MIMHGVVRRISAGEWIDGHVDIVTDHGEYATITDEDDFERFTSQCSSS